MSPDFSIQGTRAISQIFLKIFAELYRFDGFVIPSLDSKLCSLAIVKITYTHALGYLDCSTVNFPVTGTAEENQITQDII